MESVNGVEIVWFPDKVVGRAPEVTLVLLRLPARVRVPAMEELPEKLSVRTAEFWLLSVEAGSSVRPRPVVVRLGSGVTRPL